MQFSNYTCSLLPENSPPVLLWCDAYFRLSPFTSTLSGWDCHWQLLLPTNQAVAPASGVNRKFPILIPLINWAACVLLLSWGMAPFSFIFIFCHCTAPLLGLLCYRLSHLRVIRVDHIEDRLVYELTASDSRDARSSVWTPLIFPPGRVRVPTVNIGVKCGGEWN